MSAFNTKRTSPSAPHMSAFGVAADMAIALRNVRKWPRADKLIALCCASLKKCFQNCLNCTCPA